MRLSDDATPTKLFIRAVLRYGMAVIAIGGALGLARVFARLNWGQPFTAFAFCAIAITFWFADIGPGILAALLAAFVRSYLADSIATPALRTVFDVVFGTYALLMIQATRARHELETIVADRTSDLEQTNENLRLQVAERQRAEEAREEIEEQWKAAFESNPTMYFIVDSAGTTVSVNTFGAEQLGYRVEELIGRPVLDVFYEPDREPVQTHANSCFQQPGRTRRWEARKIRKDGAMIWVRESAKAVFLKKRPVLLVVCEDITEQKRAEEAARRSEKELRDLIETMPTMVFSIRPDGSTEFASRNWQNFAGLSLEKTTGPGWQSTIHPDDLDTHLSKWRVSMASDKPFENEVRHRGTDGEYRWFLVRAEPLRDDQGKVLKWYGTLTDIEDRKRVEQALHAATSERMRIAAFRWEIGTVLAHEENLKRTLHNCAEVMVRHLDAAVARVWTLTSDGRELQLQASAGMYTRLDGSHSRIPFGQLKIGLIAQERKPHLTNNVQDDPRVNDKEWARREKMISFAGYPLMVEDRVVGVMGMFSQKPLSESTLEALSFVADGMAQVIDRKRAEEALQRSEKRFRDVIETIPSMAWTTLPDGTNDFANRMWLDYTGISAEDVSGAGWKASFHPADIAIHLDKWHASLVSGKPFETEARVRRAQDGEYRWFVHRAVPLRDENGQILKWYGISTDIDDRKRAESLLTGEKRILEMVAKGDSLSQILDSLCRLVEEQASRVLTSILLIEDGCLRHGAAPSLPKAYTDAIDGVVIGPSVGSCGTAAYRGQQVIVQDIATDPLWADYREAALPHSLRACWSTPIFSSQRKVMATFAMYYREPRSPSQGDQQIIEQITHLAGVAIERKLTQEALKRSEAYLGEAQRLTHTGSWAWDPRSGKMIYCSEELYRIFALDPPEHVPPREFFLERVHPEDRDTWGLEGREGTEYTIEYRILLPDGTIKYVLSRRHPVFDATGALIEIIGTTVDVTDRKRAEQALRESEELKRRIIESSTDCINVLDLDGNLLFMSGGGQQLLEIDNIQPYLNTCWIDFWQPEDRPKVSLALAAAKAGGIGKFQAFSRSAKGTPRWWDVITTPICNADGQPEQLLSVSRDITESKRAEELLRESEGRFRTIFENAGAGITLVDKQGHPIKCNAMFEKMLGYTEEELRSMVFTEFTHPDDIQADWTLYRELVDGQRDRYELEKRYIKKDGRVMWGQLIVSRVKGKDGAFADYHVGMVEDITERKRAEQALQRSESYLAEAQRLTHTGSWAFNPATAKNNYWSEEMFRIFAVDSQRGLPTSETFWNRVHPEDRDSVYKMFENAAREKTEYEHDHRIVLPDGTVKHIHAIGHPVFNTAGEIVEFVGTSIDVTERKRAEQERERLQQLQAELARMNRVTTMGELTASLAHEINQPIAAAVTNASTSLRWLAIDPPNIEEAREAAKRSVKDANRAAEIIGRIRQLFRKGTAERELLDINEVIREMIVLLLNEAHRYSISLRTDLDTDLPSIVADRVQLQQVLMNLMLNGIDAIKDADGERELTIKSGRQNRDLLISVTDTGKGLPANEEEKIFDAFFTTKTDGTGMGLSISRSIIESHGGRLWAMNNTLHGATFYFTLPTNVEAQDDDARWRSYGVHY